jgi:hypothetical protein
VNIVVLVIVTFAMIASLLLVVAAGLLIYRDRRSLGIMTERLLAEQRIEAATRATLQAMRDAARQQMRG